MRRLAPAACLAASPALAEDTRADIAFAHSFASAPMTASAVATL